MTKLFKVYELDFGDTNLLTEDVHDVLNWIRADAEDLKKGDELNYTIKVRMMSRTKIDALPEWA